MYRLWLVLRFGNGLFPRHERQLTRYIVKFGAELASKGVRLQRESPILIGDCDVEKAISLVWAAIEQEHAPCLPFLLIVDDQKNRADLHDVMTREFEHCAFLFYVKASEMLRVMSRQDWNAIEEPATTLAQTIRATGPVVVHLMRPPPPAAANLRLLLPPLPPSSPLGGPMTRSRSRELQLMRQRAVHEADERESKRREQRVKREAPDINEETTTRTSPPTALPMAAEPVIKTEVNGAVEATDEQAAEDGAYGILPKTTPSMASTTKAFSVKVRHDAREAEAREKRRLELLDIHAALPPDKQQVLIRLLAEDGYDIHLPTIPVPPVKYRRTSSGREPARNRGGVGSADDDDTPGTLYAAAASDDSDDRYALHLSPIQAPRNCTPLPQLRRDGDEEQHEHVDMLDISAGSSDAGESNGRSGGEEEEGEVESDCQRRVEITADDVIDALEWSEINPDLLQQLADDIVHNVVDIDRLFTRAISAKHPKHGQAVLRLVAAAVGVEHWPCERQLALLKMTMESGLPSVVFESSIRMIAGKGSAMSKEEMEELSRAIGTFFELLCVAVSHIFNYAGPASDFTTFLVFDLVETLLGLPHVFWLHLGDEKKTAMIQKMSLITRIPADRITPGIVRIRQSQQEMLRCDAADTAATNTLTPTMTPARVVMAAEEVAESTSDAAEVPATGPTSCGNGLPRLARHRHETTVVISQGGTITITQRRAVEDGEERRRHRRPDS